jgi:hypothetical protein
VGSGDACATVAVRMEAVEVADFDRIKFMIIIIIKNTTYNAFQCSNPNASKPIGSSGPRLHNLEGPN